MPLLAALNEYDSAITKIAIYADLALEDPAYQETAIWLIHDLCHRTDESVENIIKPLFHQEATIRGFDICQFRLNLFTMVSCYPPD